MNRFHLKCKFPLFIVHKGSKNTSSQLEILQDPLNIRIDSYHNLEALLLEVDFSIAELKTFMQANIDEKINIDCQKELESLSNLYVYEYRQKNKIRRGLIGRDYSLLELAKDILSCSWNLEIDIMSETDIEEKKIAI